MELGGSLQCLWMWGGLLWYEWGWKRFAGQRIRTMVVGLQGNSMILMVVDYMAGMQRVMMMLHKDIWRRTDLAGRLSMVRPRLLLCQEGFRRKWGSIADSVAVAEVAVLPLELQEVSMQGEEVEGAHQGAAVAKLGAAGG